MSKRKKTDEVVATGADTDEELDTYPFAETLLKSLQSKDMVIIRVGYSGQWPGEWLLPRDLLRAESSYFHKELAKGSVKELSITDYGAPVLELFIQWLYSQRYQEREVSVPALSLGKPWASRQSLHANDQILGMPWCIKAAILSWTLGRFLGCPKFQDYAMRRLFSAYSRRDRVFVRTSLFQYLSWWKVGNRMMLLFEDLVIRNWGDTSIIDSNDSMWSELFKGHDRLRTEFLVAVARPLAQRRQIPMDVNNYLILS